MSAQFDTTAGSDVFGARPRRPLAIVAVALVVLFAGMGAATQTVAARFDRQPLLGAHYKGIYPPWAFIGWSTRWGGQYPDEFRAARRRGMGVGAIGAFLVFALLGSRRRRSYIHGAAHWAREEDIRRVGLLPRKRFVLWRRGGTERPPGVIVGQWVDRRGRSHYLIDRGPGHILGMAPTRTGKGVGFVVPTLLFWTKSAFVYDMKGELFALTAGWRKLFARNRVVRLDPVGRVSAHWNPMDEIQLGTDTEVADAANLAYQLMDPDGKGVYGDHWRETSFALAAGLLLHVAYKARVEGSEATLNAVDALIANPDKPLSRVLEEMITFPHKEDGKPHEFVRKAAQDQRMREGPEAASVVSSLQTALNLFRDPAIARVTGCSDFRIADLMHGAKPMSLYFVVPEKQADRLRPLMRLFLDMMIGQLADGLEFEGGRPKPSYKHQLLVMLDEFPFLRKLARVERALSVAAGFGIRFYLLVQGRAQMTAPHAYGEYEAITDNCDTQFYLPPNRIETAEYISRMLGDTTHEHKQVSVSGGGWFAKKTYTYQLVRRPLLAPSDIKNMPGPQHDRKEQIVNGGSMILLAKGCPPIKSPKQPLYFRDRVFSKRAAVPAPKEAVSG